MLTPDGQLEALRMLVDHRDQLSNQRVATANRLHRLLAELTPGRAKKDITALQAKAVLASVRPRDASSSGRQVASNDSSATGFDVLRHASAAAWSKRGKGRVPASVNGTSLTRAMRT